MTNTSSDPGAGRSHQLESGNVDAQLKLAELELKRSETEKIKAEIGKGRVNWAVFGPLLVGISVAFIGMFSTIYVAWMNGRSQTEFEALKAKTTLIIEAVKTGSNDPTVAQRNIKFFLGAGLLSDPDGRIARSVEEGNLPVFSALGVELTFERLPLLQNIAQDKKSCLLSLILRLDSKEFVRLMYVGQLINLCEFDHPSSEMREDTALDYSLRDKGLVNIVVSPALLNQVRTEMASSLSDLTGSTRRNALELLS